MTFVLIQTNINSHMNLQSGTEFVASSHSLKENVIRYSQTVYKRENRMKQGTQVYALQNNMF